MRAACRSAAAAVGELRLADNAGLAAIDAIATVESLDALDALRHVVRREGALENDNEQD